MIDLYAFFLSLPYAAAIEPHLPVLQVVFPLLCAPICVLLRDAKLSWAWVTIVTWVTFFIALVLLGDRYVNGQIDYQRVLEQIAEAIMPLYGRGKVAAPIVITGGS